MSDPAILGVGTTVEVLPVTADGLDEARSSTQVHVLAIEATEGQDETVHDISYPVGVDSLYAYVDEDGGKEDGDRVCAFAVVKAEDGVIGTVRATSASGQNILAVSATVAGAMQAGLAVEVTGLGAYVVAAVDATPGSETLTLASNLTGEAAVGTTIKYLFGFCRATSASGQKVLAVTPGLAGTVQPLQWIEISGGKRYMVTAVDQTPGSETLTVDENLDAEVAAGTKIFYRVPFLTGLGSLTGARRKGRKLFANSRFEIGAEVETRSVYIPPTVAIRVHYSHVTTVPAGGKTVEFCFAFRYHSKPEE